MKEDKIMICEALIGLGAFLIVMGFMAGIVITIVGGNNWELMKGSPFIMAVWNIDQLVMWFGLILAIGSSVIYNLNNKD